MLKSLDREVDMWTKFLQIDTRVGDPITVGDTTLLPLAKSLRLRLPGRRGGVIWNRPASVVVQTAGGQEYSLPVRDVTRQVQFALIGGGLAGIFLVWLLTGRKK
jgi:hypothetical protein